jgi:hypothetical protein
LRDPPVQHLPYQNASRILIFSNSVPSARLGSGKMHLAIALGALTAEMGHRIYFTSAIELVRRIVMDIEAGVMPARKRVRCPDPAGVGKLPPELHQHMFSATIGCYKWRACG